jgi:hypothetical protein
MRMFDRRLAAAAASVIALCVGPAPAALAAPTQVTLHLDGTHPVGAEFHQGTFTASPPLCPLGSWLGNGAGSRVFTCSDGSGTFTAKFNGELEHVAGFDGPWLIFAGSGKYATLRGKGLGKVDTNQGGDTPPVIFSDTWTGEVDFDATAPTGSITAVKVTHPRFARGRWSTKVTFSARDNVEANSVSFSATATAGNFFATKTGTVTAGIGSFTLTFRPAKSTRLLRIQIQLSDPWGNETTIRKTVRLR